MQRVMWVVLGLGVLISATACGSGSAPSPTPSAPAVVTRTASATPTQSVEAQVSAAYLAYWDAYSRAVLELDESVLAGVAASEELASIRKEIEQHRRDGVAVRINVEHDFAVVQFSERAATVVDRVTNQSFFVDPITKQPETSNVPAAQFRYTFFLERTSSGWVVVRGQRESP